MVPEKRKLMVVSAALAAVVALPGCAPAGYDAADYGNAAEPAAANVAATPGASATEGAVDPNEADPTAEATEPAAPADAAEVGDDLVTKSLTGTSVARMGKVVEDQDGFVLYRFDDDGDDPAKSNCNGDCAKVWPPALTNDGEPTLKGVSADLVGTVTRADGTKQLTLKGWPLYRYVGDKKPGQWKGQNVNGKWFVITPTGTKNLTCLPKISKPVAPPADSAGSDSSDAGDSGSDYSY
ncbi:COG4315 family predicted lipoprotein [Actinoplanes teichomyceticus]|uniref:Putative lipoprotein with Yx(FWY)xxD motif n=1 Tax=Actinoplanes teichomyceticus TaxID=1867 RepID=A0A561WMT5_ACTTI|nr:putative lipoprotein with Yx(FWY)xxD motif [Actinoplanes teichomyceticus]